MKLPTKAAIIALLGDFTFVLTILAALPYELGDVAQYITPDLKALVVKLGIFSTIGLKVIQRIMERLQGTRDARNIEVAATTTRGLPPSVVVLLLCALFMGCATNTPDAVKNARNAGLNAAGRVALNEAVKVLGNAAVQTLFSVAQSEASGGKVDWMQSASTGLWSQANIATSSAAISNIVNAFSAGKAAQTAQVAARAGGVALAMGEQPVKVSNALATVISTATGAPPAKN